MNIETVIPNLLYTRFLTAFDNSELLQDCTEINQYINTAYPLDQKTKQFGSVATTNFKKYNIFTFIRPSISKLFIEIKNTISSNLSNEPFMIGGWLNAIEKDGGLPWHGHWHSYYQAWHGFYCVDTEPDSFTTYKFENVEEEIKIPSRDGLLVFGISNNSLHKTSPWHDHTRPRITIAFDIIPVRTLLDNDKHRFNHNHYIPFC